MNSQWRSCIDQTQEGLHRTLDRSHILGDGQGQGERYVVREVGERSREWDCHGVPGSRHCGDTAGVLEAIGLGLVSESPGKLKTVSPTTTENYCHDRPCCQQEDSLSLNVMGHLRLERTLD